MAHSQSTNKPNTRSQNLHKIKNNKNKIKKNYIIKKSKYENNSDNESNSEYENEYESENESEYENDSNSEYKNESEYESEYESFIYRNVLFIFI